MPGDCEPALAARESMAAVKCLTAGTMRWQVGQFPAVPQGDGITERTLACAVQTHVPEGAGRAEALLSVARSTGQRAVAGTAGCGWPGEVHLLLLFCLESLRADDRQVLICQGLFQAVLQSFS